MTSIENGESGASVRAKLNSALARYDQDGFANVAALLADVTLAYGQVSAGDIIRTRSEGFAYTVAASGASDHHVATAGGVRLYVLPCPAGVDWKSTSALGDGAADDAHAIQSAVDAAPSVSVRRAVSFYKATTAIMLPTGRTVWSNGAEVYQDTPSTPLFDVAAANPAISDVIVQGLRLSQDTSAAISGGSSNNHALVKFRGGEYNRAAFNHLSGQYGVSFGHGISGLADRRHRFGVAMGNVLDGLQGMGIENLGASYTAVVGNIGDASNSRGAGTRAAFHGLRLSGYSIAAGDSIEAKAVGVVAAGNAFKGFARGLAMQNASSLWNVSSQYIEDADCAAQLFTSTSDLSAPQMGYTNFTASNVGAAILGDGHGYSAFDFIADGDGSSTSAPFIEEASNAAALGHNRYRGILRNPKQVGAHFRYDNQTIDLTVDGSATTGVLIAGNYCTGTIVVNRAGSIGITIAGSNNLFRVVVRDATGLAVNVTGSGNSIDIQTNGNVSVSGNNNQIRGIIGGTITKSGTGNDYTSVRGFVAGGVFTATTSAAGEVTLTPSVHQSATLSGIAAIVSNFSNNWCVRVKSLSSGVYTFVVFDTAGATVNNTSVQIRWNLVAL